MGKRLLLILFSFTFLIVGCGTVNRKSVVLPVDSEPRGLKVYDDKLELLGITPFFHSVKPQRKRIYNIMINEERKLFHSYAYRCPFNWWGSIVPNALVSPFFPTGTIFSVGFYAADFSSEAIFKCEDPVSLNMLKQEYNISGKDIQKRIIILPANHADRSISQNVFKAWKEKFYKAENNEYEIVDPKKTQELFTFNGITSAENWTIDNVPMPKVWEVAEEFKATHIMIFDVNDEGETLIVNANVYDIFNLKKIELEGNEEFTLSDPYDKVRDLFKFFINSVSLLPNALNWSPFFSRTLYYDGENGLEKEVVAQKHPDGLPKFVTAWGIEDVDNPLHFRTWDFNFKLYPSLHAQAWSYNTGEYYIEVISWNFMYNGGINFHTPMGALGVSAGIGPVFVTGDDSLRKEYDQVDISTKFELSWYGFVRKRWYMKLSGSIFQMNGNVISNKHFTLTKWQEVYLGIGFYFPELRDRLRSLIPD